MERKLKKVDVFSLVLGAIIGWGAFMLPGTKFLQEAGVINTAIGLICGALAIIIVEKNYMKMMAETKDVGGEFSYTYKNMGKKHGFVVGWFLTLAYIAIIPLNATAFPLVVKKLFNGLLEKGYLYTVAGHEVYLAEVLLSSIIIIAFAYLNIKGIEKISKYQNIIVFSLVGSVLIIFAIMLFKVDMTFIKANYISNYDFNFGEIFKIFAIAPWAFIGFDVVAQLSEDFNFSAKRASKVAICSLVFGVLIYNILNIATAMVFTPGQAIELDWATGMAVESQLGKVFFYILVISLTGAVWSGINGFFVGTSKLIGALAEYTVIPKVYGEKNSNGAYKKAIIAISVVSLIAPWFGRVALNWIVDMSSVGAAVAYMYVSFIGFKKAQNIKEKIFGVLGTLISILFIALLIIPGSPAALGIESFVALLVWMGIGYFYFRKNSTEFKEHSEDIIEVI